MRLLPVLVAALLLTGCAAGPSEAPADAVRAPADVCHTSELGDAGLWIEADGNKFEAAVVGEESTVAVLVHQSGANYCGWARFVHLLRENGIRVVLLNLCGSGETECASEEHLVDTGASAVIAAAEWADANGAGRLVVVGASLGGIVAFAAAGTDQDGLIDAVVDLSGPISFEGSFSSDFAPGVTAPLYFAVSPTDTVVTVEEFENLSAQTASDSVKVYPDGVGHGWDMLFDQTLAPSELALDVVAFIQG